MKIIRVRCRQVQVPSYGLMHPDGRVIVLVGVMHAGDAQFFNDVTSIINNNIDHGYKVLYERIGEIDSDETKSLSDSEKEALSQLGVLRDLTQWLVQLTGLTSQFEAIKPSELWVNTDIGAGELVRKLAEANADLFPQGEAGMEGFRKQEGVIKRFMRFMMRHPRIALSVIFAFSKIKRSSNRRSKQIIIDYRNERGIEMSRPHFLKGNVAMIWGAAHLPGLMRLLAAEGYMIQDVKWLTVLDASTKH
jgi:hypothetical protein